MRTSLAYSKTYFLRMGVAMTGFALVTGASRGVGRAAATYLSRNGYSLIVAARSADALDAVIAGLSGGGHRALVVDLSTELGIRRVIDSVQAIVGDSGLRVFLHCAAETPDPEGEATLADTSPNTLHAHIATTASAGPYLLGR